MFGKVNEDSFQDILQSASCFSDERFHGLNRAKLEQQQQIVLDNCLNSNQTRQLLLSFASTSPSSSLSSSSPLSEAGSIGGGAFDTDQKRLCLSPTLSTSTTSSSALSSASSQASSSATNSPGKVNASRYKTELCRPYQEHGTCKYGEKCQFAHGMPELRVVSRHPKYKTDLCRTYHSIGFCPYGPRCHFIHNLDEMKQRDAKPVRDASSSSMPPLPMFSPDRLTTSLAITTTHGGAIRLRNLSECGGGSGYTSSSSQSPSSSLAEIDSESEVGGMCYVDAAGSPTRLPVFSTLSK